MASSFVVIATDLRRVTVKVPTGGYMIDVLEEACSRLKLPSENYLLKHNNKPINLTDPIRAAGLTQGAKLELIVKSKSPSVVTVALRLPASEAGLGFPNGRVSAKVRSDTTVWKLLRILEEQDRQAVAPLKPRGLNLTARGVPQTSHGGSIGGSGQLYWETPVLRFAGRELSSLADFARTLSQVGIHTGSQLVMLQFRVSSMPLQEAMEAVQQQLEKVDAEATADAATAAAEPVPEEPAQASAQLEPTVTAAPTPTPAPEKAAAAAAAAAAAEAATSEAETQSASTPQPTQTTAAPEEMDVDDSPPADPLRPVQVWAPPKAGSGGMPAAAALRWRNEDPEASTSLLPTVAQMKAHQKHLETAGRNKRLKSDAELEAETRARAAAAAAVRKVDVRVRFPDGYTVLWSLPNGATGATLHAAVRSVLSEAAQPPNQQQQQQQQPQSQPQSQPQQSWFRLVPPMSRDEVADRSDDKHDLVRGYSMRGGVVLNFLRGTSAQLPPPPPPGKFYLKPDVIALARDIVVPGLDNDADDEKDKPAASASAAAAAAAAAGSGQGKTGSGKGDVAAKMSKFLRLAKK